MELEEWIERYERKTKDKHICPGGYSTIFDEGKGYFQYKVEGNRLWVYEVCGDGKYWYNMAESMCRKKKLPFIVTICTRPILPYLRLMQGRITHKENQPQRNNAYKIEGVNHLGLRFFVFAAWWDDEKKRHAYYVVSEVLNNDEI